MKNQFHQLLIDKGYPEWETRLILIDYQMGLNALKVGEEPSDGEWDAIHVITDLRINN